MSAPKVSVMMPCYQAADTLGMALASVRSQTMEEWECLCVDDGSDDATYELLARAASDDPRFKVHRFRRNRGRGAARQYLLERVNAPLIAFLDADDWMFPERLERQSAWLCAEPELAAVSAPMAIFSEDFGLVGEASPREHSELPAIETLTAPAPPALSFPSSMLRSRLVKQAGFDMTLRRSQDSDMLIRALLGRRYALGSWPLYAYRRAAMTLEKTLEGYRYRIRAHRKHLRAYPARVSRTIAETMAKAAVFRLMGLFDAHHRLLDARYGVAPPVHAEAYRNALSRVRSEESLWLR